MKNLVKVVLVLALAAGLTACKKNVKDDANGDLSAAAAAAAANANTDNEGFIAEGLEIDETQVQIPVQEVALGVVHFALDKYNLSAEDRKIVETNAQAIKTAAGSVTNYEVIVEGNCDDRGTVAYNIALGQKRADEVKAYYVRLGIPAKNISTISYGKEKPVCFESTQKCWAENRRADTLLRVN